MKGCVPSRLEQRRTALVTAAQELFLEQGYERTTLGDVVARAGGSLATVYKLFGDKEGLLVAAIEHNSISWGGIVQEIEARGLSHQQTLREIAYCISDHLAHPGRMALARVVIAHSIANPAFAVRFFEETVCTFEHSIATLLRRWSDAGLALSDEPEMLASIYAGLLGNDFHHAAIFHHQSGVASRGDIDRRLAFFETGAGIARC
jgi:TetR/AcrR family transcriptional regulator, mexJK operon transcriptional repressor